MALVQGFESETGRSLDTLATAEGRRAAEDLVINLSGVSKLYRIWASPAARFKAPVLSKVAGLLPAAAKLRDKLSAKAAGMCRDFYAVSDVNLQVRRGESVAIVGRNGAGKSTLLQIIAGTLQATSGSVAVQGRVAALLELGSGFNPEFTGRENVYLNASILGLSKDEINQRFESIVEFAEIGEYLDQPVKTYSSGMVMRLAFAVQTAIEPDVLIVDEALSVGDSLFQAKCMTRMRKMLDNGLTLLFVTHDVSLVTQLCRKALYLRNGEQRLFGNAADVVDLYLRDLRDTQAGVVRSDLKPISSDTSEVTHASSSVEFLEDAGFDDRVKSYRYGSGRARVRALQILGADGEPSISFCFREKITVRAHIETYGEVSNLNCCLLIRNRLGVEILHATSHQYRHRFPVMKTGERIVVDISFENILKAGQGYAISFTVNDTVTPESQEILDLIELAASFEVRHDPTNPIYYLIWHPFEFSHHATLGGEVLL
ncbi:MAG: ABC transporter ATP-binding protein [Pseudomonadota bacterium]|jgi:lipopolysaccharide transport system ATP-binding protein